MLSKRCVTLPSCMNPPVTMRVLGFLRIVDRAALKDMIRLVLDTLLEHAWPLSGISHDRITQELVVQGDADGSMLECALKALGGEREGDIWRLESRAVAQEVARRVFCRHVQESGGNRRVAEDDFMIEWTMGIPVSLTCPPLEFLRGIAVREEAADAKIPPAPGHVVKYPCFHFMSLDEMPANNCEVRVRTLSVTSLLSSSSPCDHVMCWCLFFTATL